MKRLFLTLTFLSLLLVSGAALAADPAPKAGATSDKITQLKVDAATLNKVKLKTMAEVVGQVIKFFSALMGTIAFALYIYAGGLWMTASGNEEQITKAKNILVWATMGVGVMLSSYILVKFVLDSVLTG